MSLQERLTSDCPKRILALDGGGARIMMSLGFLEEIERVLRERHGRPDFRLCDYFDLIGGTSAGALIAAALATGLSMSEVTRYALHFAEMIFRKKNWKPWEAIYDEAPLAQILKEQFGDTELGDASIQTGLCIVTKRADTRSTWPFLNHPDGRFFDMNKHILLRKAIQASTAAPTYFVPVAFDVGDGEKAAFVDGGVSTANNPSLLMLAVATLSGYPFRWPTGPKRLLLTSVGTGFWQNESQVDRILDSKIWDYAWEVPLMLMDDISVQNELMLQWMSRTPTPWMVDAEVGDLADDLLTPDPLLHYLRYNVRIEKDAIYEIDLPEFGNRVDEYRDLSCVGRKNDMLAIGRAAARRQVNADHFPLEFDTS